MKFYLPILKHLVIQLAKLQIYTLNLTTTFDIAKKNPITFEQECTYKVTIELVIFLIDALFCSVAGMESPKGVRPIFSQVWKFIQNTI